MLEVKWGLVYVGGGEDWEGFVGGFSMGWEFDEDGKGG